jgi:photosystem II stability/assembly factor-like uncharacterized protein
MSLGTGIDVTPRQVFSISVPDDNTVWAVTWDNINFNPVFEFTKTTDGGQTWVTGTLDIDATHYAAQIYAHDDTKAWLCTTDFTTGYLYKTSDGGQTWIQQTTAFNTVNEIPIGIHFFNDESGIVFGAPGQDFFDNQIKIYTTMDGGDTWTKIPTSELPDQLPGEGITDELGNGIFSVVGNNIWFPTTMNRVFRSQDMGNTWEVFDNDLSGAFSYEESVSIAMKDSLNGIIISNGPNEAVRTTDGGESWETITMNLPTQGILELGQINYIPGTPGTYLIHDSWDDVSTIAYFTEDGGDSWETIETGANLSCSVFLNPSTGYGGGDLADSENGGIYKWEGDELVSSRDIMDSEEEIKLFPVPASNYLNIELPQNSSPESITIKDYSGKTYFTQGIPTGDSDFSFNIEGLPTGFYFLEVIMENTSVTRKLMKVRH